MPAVAEFKANFEGHAIPSELEKLCAFDVEADLGYLSDGFELTVDDKGGLKSWSDNPEFLGALMPFAQANGSGSFYALWAGASKTPSEMPVVVFGDEGGVHVVAENVLALLQILTFDAEPMIDDDGVTFYKDEDDHEPSNGHDAYVEWLDKTFGLAPVDDAEPLVESAREKHQAGFEAWAKRFYG
jgi:hypothetical protein